jgi:NADH-quinone oxidoreductase subunit L
MWIGTLAIAGIPPLAGFFSKDEILTNAFAGPDQGGMGHWSLFAIGWLIAGMTAFYMTRMMMKTFYGQPRYDEETGKHIHESPQVMLVPLYVLALLSIVGGFIGGFAPLHIASPFEKFLGKTVEWREAAGQALHIENSLEWGLVIASVVVAVIGMGWAFSAYSKLRDGEKVPPEKKQPGSLWYFLYNKWGVDEIYDRVFVDPGRRFSQKLWRVVDLRIVDGMVNGLAASIAGLGNSLKNWQSGYVRNYALSMLLGVIVVIVGCLIGLRAGIR